MAALRCRRARARARYLRRAVSKGYFVAPTLARSPSSTRCAACPPSRRCWPRPRPAASGARGVPRGRRRAAAGLRRAMKTLARERDRTRSVAGWRVSTPAAPAAGGRCQRTRWSAISATRSGWRSGEAREPGRRSSTAPSSSGSRCTCRSRGRRESRRVRRSIRTWAARPGDFAADVADLVRCSSDHGAAARLHVARHPLFGPLTDAAWLRWAYLHMDHHLRQFGA